MTQDSLTLSRCANSLESNTSNSNPITMFWTSSSKNSRNSYRDMRRTKYSPGLYGREQRTPNLSGVRSVARQVLHEKFVFKMGTSRDDQHKADGWNECKP